MRWILSPITGIILLLVTAVCFAGLSGSLSEKAISERLTPDAKVNVESTGAPGAAAAQPATAAKSADIGEQRYEETCKMCHETGLAGAPKFGDKADWAPRISEGINTLVQHALHGYKAMPAKGGCSTCSDDEIQKAVEYMVNHAK
jgi:cytochrome c5